MAILEAMSFGLQVVSTSIIGIPDVVVNGETGILIEPGKVDDLTRAIIELITDCKLRKKRENKEKTTE